MIDMTQNCSFLQHKGNFSGILKNNKTTQICLEYGLRCAGASILERCLKNNRLSPKTMVQKNLSLATYKFEVFKVSSINISQHDDPELDKKLQLMLFSAWSKCFRIDGS